MVVQQGHHLARGGGDHPMRSTNSYTPTCASTRPPWMAERTFGRLDQPDPPRAAGLISIAPGCGLDVRALLAEVRFTADGLVDLARTCLAPRARPPPAPGRRPQRRPPRRRRHRHQQPAPGRRPARRLRPAARPPRARPAPRPDRRLRALHEVCDVATADGVGLFITTEGGPVEVVTAAQVAEQDAWQEQGR